jgi:uncharacterized protein YjbI with pentapeptide repeats
VERRSWAPKIDVLLAFLWRSSLAPIRAMGRAYFWLNNLDVPREGQAPAPPALPSWSRLSPGWRRATTLLGFGAAMLAVAVALWFLLRTVAVALGMRAGWVGDWTSQWDEVRTGLLILAALLGAPFVIWRTVIAARQAEIAQQSHFTDLYSKGVEMLGADKTAKRRVKKDGAEEWETVETSEPNIEVRLGGVYALERVAGQSDNDYRAIVEVLAAYVRQNAGPAEEPEAAGIARVAEPEDPEVETPREREARLEAIEARAKALREWGERLREKGAARWAARPDVGAALTALERRPMARRLAMEGWPEQALEAPPRLKPDEPCTPERGAAIRAAWAEVRDAAAALGRAGWAPDLCGANAQGVSHDGADWRRMRLDGARLDGASLQEAKLRFASASRASFAGADLFSSELSFAELAGADFTGGVLNEARLQGSDLAFAIMDCGWLVNARLDGTDLGHARLQHAAARNVTLLGAEAPSADFTRGRLDNGDLRAVDLTNAVLDQASLTSADLRGSLLWRASLRGASAARTRFDDANMLHAALTGAALTRARFDGAALIGADLAESQGLRLDQLALAFGDGATTLPEPLEAERPRLIAEAGWSEAELDEASAGPAWAAWRARRATHFNPAD